MRVLVAEDHAVLARTLALGLRREGMAVDVALDGAVALDRDLPAVHGDEVCRRMVDERVEARVLMLTASGSVEDRVGGLGIGADDYLTKPFDFSELVARVRALGRRPPAADPLVFACGDLVVDPARRSARRAGRDLPLSPKEFAVLECLLAADGRVVSTEELLERVWDDSVDPFTTTPPLVETVREGGYRIVPSSGGGTR
jgi:DNA-binding response OmpR family regulator